MEEPPSNPLSGSTEAPAEAQAPGSSSRRGRRRWIVVLPLAGLIGTCAGVGAFAMPAVRNDRAGLRASDRAALTSARHFRRFTLFYLGPSFRSDALTGATLDQVPPAYKPVVNSLPSERVPSYAFLYGTCTPSGGGGLESPSCTPPIQIQNDAACALNPHSIEGGPLRRISVRGVPANVYDDQLDIYTKSTTISIFDFGGLPAELRLAQALGSLDGSSKPGSRLPRPTGAALSGRLRCRPAKRGQ